MKLALNRRFRLALLVAAGCALVPFAGEARLLSGFYDPDRTPNSWTLTWTNDTQTAGYIQDGTWTVLVTCYNATARTLKLADACLAGAKSSTVLDLTGQVLDGNGDAWTITRCYQHSFQNQGTGLKELYMPHEFINTDSQLFNGNGFNNNLTTLVLDMPNSTVSIGAWCFSTMSKLTKLYMNLPLMTTFNDHYFGPPLTATDVTDWRLDKLTTISSTYGGWLSHAFDGCKFTGTLNLPALSKVTTNDFKNASCLGGILIGTNTVNAEVRVLESAFLGCASLSNVVLGTASSTYSFATNAFAATGLKTITLNGSYPSYRQETGLVFGTAETAEKTLVFRVPFTTAWLITLRRKGLVALTDEERTAYAAAHPDEVVPYGVVQPGAFRTQNPQYVAFQNRKVTLSQPVIQCYGNDQVSMTSTEPPDENGGYPTETVFTFTATPAATPTEGHYASHFNEWRGLPAGCRTNNPCVVSLLALVEADKSAVTAHFSHDWVFTPDTEGELGSGSLGTISDGEWTLRATSKGNQTLQIGTTTAVSAWITRSTVGSLDFAGDLYLAGHAGESAYRWKITSITQDSLAQTDNPETAITEVYAPKTLSFLEQSWRYMPNATNIVFDCPLATGTSSYMLSSTMTKIKRLVLVLPKATSIGNYCMAWIQGGFDDTDYNEWDLSSLKTIALYGLDFAGTCKAKGTLKLPKLTSVGVYGLSDLLGNATNVVFGDYGRQNISFADYSLSYNFRSRTDADEPVRIEFRTKGTISASGCVFAGAGAVSPVELVFAGRPPSAETLTLMTSNSTWSATTDAKTVTVLGSKELGWRNIDGITAPTDAETAAAPERYAADDRLGVFSSTWRSAWIVHKSSVFDPKGVILLVR